MKVRKYFSYLYNGGQLSSDEKTDRLISLAVCMQVTIVGIKNALVQAVPRLYAINSLLNMILIGIVAIFYIVAVSYAGKRFVHIRASVFVILAFILVSLSFSSIMFPGNGYVIMRWMPRMLPYCFITFLYLAELKTLLWIEYYMCRFCYITIAFAVISAFYINRIGHITSSTWSTYSMPLSYVTLVAVMWFLYKFFSRERFIDLFFALIGIAIIVLYGSRNPLLAIASYMVIQTVRHARSGKISGGRRILYILMCIIFIVTTFFWKQIVILLVQTLESFSIRSRTLNLLVSSSDFTSGRDVIHTDLLNHLNEHPLLGLGVGGDIISINESAHGLYLSILANFGYIIGTLVIITILIICAKGYFQSKGNTKEIVLLYICLTLPRGFTGGDMWTSDVFWWMMGICIAAISIKEEYAELGAYNNDQSIAYY